ncbi:MAG: hydroxyisourate hydrolase [Acidimicrobiia bacterium]|nr:hydroxyisourate hydrolase [Acidimicrobiia bacterium]
MSAITTHILDTSRGRAAAGVQVLLEFRGEDGDWQSMSRGTTDLDGRLRSLHPDGQPLAPGVYRLTFDTARYFETHGVRAFYPEVVVVFETAPGEKHYHVPLLLSPFGFSTYRGT